MEPRRVFRGTANEGGLGARNTAQSFVIGNCYSGFCGKDCIELQREATCFCKKRTLEILVGVKTQYLVRLAENNFCLPYLGGTTSDYFGKFGGAL